MKLPTIIILTLFIFTAKAQKKVTGYYISKHTSEFQLELYENLTFLYTYNGTMGLRDKGAGSYKVSGENYIYFSFNKIEMDSLERVAKALAMSIRPKKMKYKSGKLYFLDKYNNLVKNTYLISRRKKKNVAPENQADNKQ